MDYSQLITREPGKRSGKPCIRGTRITVEDILEYLDSGMSHAEILADFPQLTENDILACLAFTPDRAPHSDCRGGVKLLFDENLSPRLVALLANVYPGSEQALTSGLGGAGDESVWEYAKLHGLTIVSKDSDFFDLSKQAGAPPKVIWVRLETARRARWSCCFATTPMLF